MASVLKTSGDYLNDLQNGMPEAPAADTRERGLDTSAAAPAGAASAPATAETASTAPAQSRISLGSAYSAPAPTNPVQGPYGRYLNPILGGAEDVGRQTEAAKGSFYEAAQPRRTYEGIGGQATLEAGINQPSQLEGARALANAQYTGPSELDADTLSRIRESSRQLSEQSRGLQSYQGLEEILHQTTPGLTPGQLGYEANYLRRNPTFRGQARGATIEAQKAGGNLEQAATEATAYGAGRKADEEAIRGASQGYLGGRLSSLNQILDQLVDTESQSQAKTQEAFNRVNESGNLADLRGSPGVDFDYESVLNQTPELQQLQEAQARREAIMQKYPDLAEIPTLDLRTNAKGREVQDFPSKWFDENHDKYTPEAYQALQAQARARQDELESLFTGATGKRAKSDTGVRGTGEFSNVAPLYYGQDFQPANVQQFLSFDPGLKPSQGNVSSEAQRGQINAIHDLLGHTERLEAQDPRRAASIGLNVLDYLKNEEDAWEAQRGSIKKAGEGWISEIRGARKKYEKAAKKRQWQKIMTTAGRVILGAGTLGLSEGSRKVLPGPSKKVEGEGTSGPASFVSSYA